MTTPGAARDLRLLGPAAAGYAGALVGLSGGGWGYAAATVALGLGVVTWRSRNPIPAVLAIALLGCLASGVLHRASIENSTVARLAERNASVVLTGRVASDPVLRRGRPSDYALVRLTSSGVRSSGRDLPARGPVLLVASPAWRSVRLGEIVSAPGRLRPSDRPDVTGVLIAQTSPIRLRAPPAPFAIADRLRGSIVRAAAAGPSPGDALVPGLVVGADQNLPDHVVADFRAAGLTHLTAVSGTNVTLVVGALVLAGRWAGVRGRGLIALGALGVVGFVVLARPEPSVLRAGVMGVIGLLSLTSGGQRRAGRTLSAATLLLLLVDPFLARSPGFALSVLATAGIVWLAPGLASGLASWLPAWLPPGTAEAIAVPTAAQLACAPVIAAIGGGVSLVAIAANLLVAPLVGPATILGLFGGVALLAVAPIGLATGWAAAALAWGIALIAQRSAALPGATVPWGAGPVAVGVLVLICLALAIQAHRLAARPVVVLTVVALLLSVLLVRLPTPGWPPRGWVMVMCDVGQGDALVLNAGTGRVVVVDAGPDPALSDRCLDRLRVRAVPVLVLTHFHADHVDGLAGVLDRRRVTEIDTSPLGEPADRVTDVLALARKHHIAVRQPPAGEERSVGSVRWRVLAPIRGEGFPGDDGSAPNNASLVLLAEVAGIRILLTGDVEPPAQEVLVRATPGLEADVLKVPHHGSRNQEPGLLTDIGARLALISAGKDNDYGHPAPETLELLRGAGIVVGRTEGAGDLAVVVRDGHLGLVRL